MSNIYFFPENSDINFEDLFVKPVSIVKENPKIAFVAIAALSLIGVLFLACSCDNNQANLISKNYYRVFANLGYVDSMYQYALICSRENKQPNTEYQSWFKKAADSDHIEAALEYGKRCFTDYRTGGSKDAEILLEAQSYLKQASLFGYKAAEKLLKELNS